MIQGLKLEQLNKNSVILLVLSVDRSGFFLYAGLFLRWIPPVIDGEPSHLDLEKELDSFFSIWSPAAPCGVVGLFHSHLHAQLVMHGTID